MSFIVRDTGTPFVFVGAILIACSLAVVQIFLSWKRLSHIPGPFIASLNELQRVFWVRTTRGHLIHQDLHEKYGEVIRTGPRNVLFSNPEAISVVYPARSGFPKSRSYTALQPYSPGGGSLHVVFNTPDEHIHRRLKTPIANLFTAQNVLSHESQIDEVLAVLQQQLESRYVNNGKVIELVSWMGYFAFDVMSTVAFSKRQGCLEEGKDVDGLIKEIRDFVQVAAPWTQVPQLDGLLRKTRVGDWVQRNFFRAPSLNLLGVVEKLISNKKAHLTSEKQKRGIARNMDANTGAPQHTKDFLTRYLEIQEQTPEKTFPWSPTAWVFSNITGGSDSVGSLTCTALFQLLARPHLFQKLQDELDDAQVSRPFPEYSEIRGLPYLSACVLEAIRMRPPVSLPLERVVPKGGITVLGHFLPEGTTVGANPYVINRHKGTFGEDAEEWRPERWLEGGEEHRKKLEASLLTFGAGRRVCLGRYLGILEITKLLAFLVANYNISIVDPDKYQVKNLWFFVQDGLFATIERRVG
ncbi:cytochrome P450 CYP4/CYP19/CYP26 subfamily protein [Astrocystis sublimbata]|nr:cytochrome P450 CYP4/CYP19/CYP26 subfamily protein [Astrocystis sublimbata]KAI0187934.1 cytochrome P450 CYP4/CYP19/CYP26 subfamily protein [Astrocystis sublimbata]